MSIHGAASSAPSWLTEVHRPSGQPRHRVVVFPHAGAGPHALTGLVDLLPAGTEVLAVSLPGRERRLAETPQTTLTRVLAALATDLAAHEPLPTTAFGCSVGALLAVRAAHRLPELFDGVVAASQAPGPGPRWPLHVTSEQDLLTVVDQAGDVPETILADADIRASILFRLRADIRLGAEAEQDFADVRLSVPLTVLGGLSDPLAPAHTLSGWVQHSSADCRVVLLTGGHFAFLAPDHHRVVSAVLGDHVAATTMRGTGEADAA
ncbi:thioesterase II family protein [Streptomyces guryensis]|uniref:Alpha/beta fold hydrolase n=1 Tax=Streptomyces guryensis TaxID=2886947 RepID=A0A9Q3VUN9_9ACTN|nr:alpha/beta fold hydrolase [Streptomyces guryensis]MCD9878934.1 alpha/beta fold hydrolase [Streptomyces guryensis]